MIETIAASIIVGLASGGLGTYVAVKVLTVEINNIKEDIREIRQKIFLSSEV